MSCRHRDRTWVDDRLYCDDCDEELDPDDFAADGCDPPDEYDQPDHMLEAYGMDAYFTRDRD